MGIICPDFDPVPAAENTARTRADTAAAIAAETAFDVLIAGGGPAGSTIATLLARKGWRVCLCEKDAFPRFHIGESLLPMGMPILERLGVLEAVEAIGVIKRGADFPAANERGYNVFHFARSLNPTWPHALQVRRDQFDAVLLDNARRAGVAVQIGGRVQPDAFDLDGVRAQVRFADGRVEAIRARYLVDATGRDTLMGDQLKLKQKNKKHQSAALFAHFRGAVRRPGDDAGNISIYRFPNGWVWLIPLPDDLMSVGAVCYPEYLKQRTTRGTEFLLDTLRSIPDVWSRLEAAEIVGNHHATGNYSYTLSAVAGPRWISVGDASAFVDPIFSSGVFLAMNSAELGAELVDQVLREPSREPALQKHYWRTLQHGIKTFSWFIERFTSPAMRHLFANPRNIWRLEEGLISMLAGDVFRDGGVRKRLLLFKVIYYLHALAMWKEQWPHLRFLKRQTKVAFLGGTTSQDHV
ncbi:hydroxylase [Ahniella affigens]|uniref:Hydroxylase n=1 Tax=Ahniella affigens TaxID=2021234 RepID=A0A2P1PY53_9GAMM|nr:NAD(P)/FAD-dependent oxidoreductase [Ahniella affigens]AVP99782.1 hydroxylase [Ahniella affigens]